MIPRSQRPILRRVRPKAVNRKRKASEFKRCYQSKVRVEWVRHQKCVACGYVPRDEGRLCENAHIETGGTGRKADRTKIVPLCWICHLQIHRVGRVTFEKVFDGIDLEKLAAQTEAAWLAAQLEDKKPK